jgi:diguanylate cyclase (GGDEF)-like protein
MTMIMTDTPQHPELPTDSQPGAAVPKARISEYTGSVLGLAVLVAANFLWFSGNPGFLGIHPHPYWLVVMPIAARYGFRAGAWSGVLAGLTLLALQRLGHPDLSLTRLLEVDNLTLPILFVCGGILLGEIREAQKKRHQESMDQLRTLKEAHQDLTHRYHALNRAKQELDTHIISQEQTLTTVYEAAKGLKSLEEKDIYPAVVEIMVDFLSAETCAIYLLEEDRLVLAASRDPEAETKRRRELSLDEGMVSTAIVSRRTVSLNALTPTADFPALAAAGTVICVPLLNSKKQVLGTLNIDKLPFIKFNPQTVRLASIIGEWCGSAIENARTYQDTRDKNISDDVTGAYTYTYFGKRFKEEFMRSRRYGQELSLIAFGIEDFKEIDDGHQQDILTVISLVFKNKLRTVDLFFHDRDASRYFIILPGTPLSGAHVVNRKMIEEIEAFKFRPYRDEDRALSILTGVSAFDGGMEHPDDLISKAVHEIE